MSTSPLYGAEVDWSVQATERLFLNLSAGYVHSRLQEDANLFPAGNPYTLIGAFEAPLGLEGDRSPAVPELTLSLSGTYTFPVPFLAGEHQGYLYFAYDYQGSSYTEYTQRPEEKAGGYGLLDLRLEYQPSFARWKVGAFVTNATDETYVKDAGNTGDSFGIPTFIAGNPRYYGVTFSLRR